MHSFTLKNWLYDCTDYYCDWSRSRFTLLPVPWHRTSQDSNRTEEPKTPIRLVETDKYEYEYNKNKDKDNAREGSSSLYERLLNTPLKERF
ncbi:hypothetical protein N7501_006186 [Penicillium viridicatum]|nr:hypothetical protein N7501_006186 [Penicillium viridicatum]